MNATDITLATLIILIFISLYLVNILAIGIGNVKKNWVKYRCNPGIMPFAKMFGHDPGPNFTYCIQTMQSNYMDHLLQPLQYNLNVVGSLGSNLSESVNSIRSFISNFRNMITDIIGNIFGVFLNLLIEIQKIIVSVKDLFKKFMGILGTLLFVLTGSFHTVNSMWAGPAGQLVRTVGKCFHPDTLIELEDGSMKPMSEVVLGDKLKYGTEVFATMRIKNWNYDSNGNKVYDEYIYGLPSEGKTGSIYVTGSHLVYNKETKEWVKVKDLYDGYKTYLKCDTLICLCTNNNLIPIDKYIFHDWDDIDGKPVVTI